jgi:hypothetical protein
MVGREGLPSLRSGFLRSPEAPSESNCPRRLPIRPLRFAASRTLFEPLPRKSKDLSPASLGLRSFEWWAEKDSNLRRHSQQIYSLPRLTAPESTRNTMPAEGTAELRGRQDVGKRRICKRFLRKSLPGRPSRRKKENQRRSSATTEFCSRLERARAWFTTASSSHSNR